MIFFFCLAKCLECLVLIAHKLLCCFLQPQFVGLKFQYVEQYNLSVVSDMCVGISEARMSKSSCHETLLILVVNYCTVDVKYQNWHPSNYDLQGCEEERHSWDSFLVSPLLFIMAVYQICHRKVLTYFYTCVCNNYLFRRRLKCNY